MATTCMNSFRYGKLLKHNIYFSLLFKYLTMCKVPSEISLSSYANYITNLIFTLLQKGRVIDKKEFI